MMGVAIMYFRKKNGSQVVWCRHKVIRLSYYFELTKTFCKVGDKIGKNGC